MSGVGNFVLLFAEKFLVFSFCLWIFWFLVLFLKKSFSIIIYDFFVFLVQKNIFCVLNGIFENLIQRKLRIKNFIFFAAYFSFFLKNFIFSYQFVSFRFLFFFCFSWFRTLKMPKITLFFVKFTENKKIFRIRMKTKIFDKSYFNEMTAGSQQPYSWIPTTLQLDPNSLLFRKKCQKHSNKKENSVLP